MVMIPIVIVGAFPLIIIATCSEVSETQVFAEGLFLVTYLELFLQTPCNFTSDLLGSGTKKRGS